MPDDDNVVQFPTTSSLRFANPGKTVLIITPDGVKVRPSDRRPLNTLNNVELLEIIDQLCELLARRM